MDKCFVCNNTKKRLQLAHIIGNRKTNRKLYGDKIIDNELNTLLACDLHCNSLIDLGFHELLKEQVALIIESDLEFEEKREGIKIIVKQNIIRKLKKQRRTD